MHQLTRHIYRRRAVSLAVLAACAIAVPAAVAGAPTQVSSTHNSKLGTILTNSRGLTLYMFSRDHARSACNGSCARVWRPLLGATVAAGHGVNPRMLKLTTRSDGNRQAAYNGHPLYTYSGDRRPGQLNGEGRHSFGGRWYAISTSGRQAGPKRGNCNPICSGY